MTNIYDNSNIKIFDGEAKKAVNDFLADDSHIVMEDKFRVVDHYYITHCVTIFYKEV